MSQPHQMTPTGQTAPHPGSDQRTARVTSTTPGLVGPGYTREWALFCDYTAAVGQPALPTTVGALTGFLADIPAAPATQARRVAAIAAAHRAAGYFLSRPTPHTGANAENAPSKAPHPNPAQMIAACPTRGWPHGFLGRRDAYLIVLTAVLGYSHAQARQIRPTDITNVDTDLRTSPDLDTAAIPRIRGRALATTDDPRDCPACTVVRWLDILGVADGLGRGSARMHLYAASAPTSSGPHHHTTTGTGRWRQTAQLLPAIDRHGWIDDYRPLSTRSISTRLALAASRSTSPDVSPTAPLAHDELQPNRLGSHAPSLEEVLTLLDQVANDADAVNNRIQALLADDALRWCT